MTQHTPGPWRSYDDSASPMHKHTVVAFGRTVAHLYCVKGCEAEDRANSHLIAAAPDMLAACEAALNYIANTEGEWGITLDSADKLRAAIAKAKGLAA